MSGKRRIALIALLVIIADQITKLAAERALSLGRSVPVVKNIFHFTLVFNKGAAFGMLKAQAPFFIALGVICVIFMLFYLPRLRKDTLPVRVAFALLLGGIIGNLIDRLRFGYVIDFLDFRIWPVFNIADSAITIGALFLILQLLRRKTKNASDPV